jgi:hypothetical protein
MSANEVRYNDATRNAGDATIEMKLEVVVPIGPVHAAGLLLLGPFRQGRHVGSPAHASACWRRSAAGPGRGFRLERRDKGGDCENSYRKPEASSQATVPIG